MFSRIMFILDLTIHILTYTTKCKIDVDDMLGQKPKMTSGPATDHNNAAVARPKDTAQDEDAPANINVVLSTAARQQQHGQHQLMSTLPPRPTQQLWGRPVYYRRDPAVGRSSPGLIIMCP